LEAAELDLLLLVGGLLGVVAEQLVHPPLVRTVGNNHKDWEE